MKRIDLVTLLGIISLVYWFVDVFNNIFLLHDSSGSLWFSSVGNGMTGVALLTRNVFLLSSLFCALFVVELGWNIGFFSHLLFHKSFMGFTDYLFYENYTAKDFLITSYHIFIIPFLLIGILYQKRVHTKAWMGAVLFTGVISFLTYFIGGPQARVNCVHSLQNCHTFLFFLEHVANPLRTMLGIIVMTILLFIPTNYLLVKLVRLRG